MDNTTVAGRLKGSFFIINPRNLLIGFWVQDRVLATCEEHGLEYVTDETNFQPEVTLRNAVRHALATGKLTDVSISPSPYRSRTDKGQYIAHDRTIRKIVTNAERLGVPLALSDGTESLRTLAGAYASKIEGIETEGRHPPFSSCLR